MKDKLYYVESQYRCAIIKANTAARARREALMELGSLAGVQKVVKATPEQIEWVRAMGGYIPRLDK